ncbi:hypothetical protein BCV70DRAFT_203202 [Testicularia cyperi]|uniref:Uncharacterized protein n=1 Tax=Testicularia cyperi TaxID=1882483 RepID=A0A317XFW9_9BASI|nr:hypothetical protein BCV70DRAFT_203202 [Testicularia cyperi]
MRGTASDQRTLVRRWPQNTCGVKKKSYRVIALAAAALAPPATTHCLPSGNRFDWCLFEETDESFEWRVRGRGIEGRNLAKKVVH